MNEIIRLYKMHGGAGYIGEEVTQYEHAFQCYLLAKNYIDDNRNDLDFTTISPYEIKLGAFLHDIGHLLEFEDIELKNMDGYGILNHEIEGSKLLKSLGFSDNICKLTENHINAKRYLITKNTDYYNKLSYASKKTFEFQGGKMNINELIKFECDNLFFWYLKLRDWDDKAKSTEKELLDYIKNYDINEIFEENKN